MQKIMPLAQFTVNLEWCASEAHTRGESLLRRHGANRVKVRADKLPNLKLGLKTLVLSDEKISL